MRGYDSDGRVLELSEVWSEEYLRRSGWYEKSYSYWEASDLSVDGVLGGYEALSPIDIATSKRIIAKYQARGMGNERAVDCGGGIGRLFPDLLFPLFRKVDLCEQSPAHVSVAKQRFSEDIRMGNFINCGLQAFQGSAEYRYDCVWVQWVVGYLTDDDLVAFLRRCADVLAENGRIIMKENVYRETSELSFYVDSDDCSIVRNNAHFKGLIRASGLILEEEVLQENFPSEIFPVRLYVMRRK